MYHVGLATVLLWLTSKIGGSDVTRRFVQTGSDVTLDIRDPDTTKNIYLLQWMFNNTISLVTAPQNGEAIVNSKSVVFHKQNSSVTLKNLQKEHGGLYEARLNYLTGNPIIYKYLLSVQGKCVSSVQSDTVLGLTLVFIPDPVSPVTVTVDSVSISSQSCNFTVNCSTEGLHLGRSFTCDKRTCVDQDGNKTINPSLTSLHLYLSNVSVICNHSNQVSWTNATANIRQVCPLTGDDKHDTKSITLHWIISVCIGCVILAGVGFSVWFFRNRQRSKTVNMENTVYAVANVKPAHSLEAATVDSPTSTYSLVGPHTGPAPAPVSPESLYATVNRVAVP